MTKSIKIGTIALASVVFSMLAFKSADNEKKEYVTIYCNDFYKELTLSYSNGSFKSVDYQKRQGNGDQAQVLKAINEHESQGYKLVNYDQKSDGSLKNQITSVLMSK